MLRVNIRLGIGLLLFAAPAFTMCGTSDKPGPTPGTTGGKGGASGAGGSSGGKAGAAGKGGRSGEAGSGAEGGGPAECDEGTANCDDAPDCEADLTSVETCGGCNNRCAYDNGIAVCDDGTCTFDGCEDGFDDCNRDEEDGCETSLSSPDDCGACGIRCSGDQECSGGRCSTISCPTGKGNCDNDASNGCETNLNTLTDCGMCGRVCALENANATCDDGTCRVDECDDEWGDCDGDRRNGCEVPLTTVGNCGGCGDPCAFDNSEASCATGTCEWVGCEPGFDDCNMDTDADGCETPIDTVDDCGACGTVCEIAHAVSACDQVMSTYECGFRACDPFWVDTNADLDSDGCDCHDLPEDAGTACETPKDLGILAPANLIGMYPQAFQQLDIVGTIPVPTKSDWYRVSIPLSRTTQGYKIEFTLATSNVFRFEVHRGCGLGTYSCQENGQTSTGLTQWEFNDNCGGSCSTPAERSNLVTDENVPTIAYVRVYRTGNDLSCEQYTLRLTRP